MQITIRVILSLVFISAFMSCNSISSNRTTIRDGRYENNGVTSLWSTCITPTGFSIEISDSCKFSLHSYTCVPVYSEGKCFISPVERKMTFDGDYYQETFKYEVSGDEIKLSSTSRDYELTLKRVK